MLQLTFFTYGSAPSQVTGVTLKANIFEMSLKARNFDAGDVGSLSGLWLLPGKLAKMLLLDCEQNNCDYPLAISVMDFTKQLVETRVDNNFVLALVVFSLQYILVNHEYWKYKVKHLRWKVTLKVLEVMKTCITSVSFLEKSGVIIHDMLLSDSSIHNALLRLACLTKQTLENMCVSRLLEPTDIEGYQHAIGSALDILYNMLSRFSKDTSPSLQVFHQALLSFTTKPVSIVAAVISLISYFQDPAIQTSAARVLSMLIITDYQQPYLSGRMFFGLDDKQISELRGSVKCILLEQLQWNEDLFVEIINLLISAARYQPALLVAIFDLQDNAEVQSSNVIGLKQPTNEALNSSPGCKKSSLIDAFMQHIERSNEFVNSKPRILLLVFDFLNALWHGAFHYIKALDYLKSSGKLWKQLSNCLSIDDSWRASSVEHLTESEAQSLAYKYRCHAAILEIIGYDIFVNKKLLHAESCPNEVSDCKESAENAVRAENSKSPNFYGLKDTLSSWCEGSILGNLIKLYTSCEYDNKICYRAKVAASLFIVHVMAKLATGNPGSLFVSLLEKISITYKNLSCQPCFLELVAKYSQQGYSEGNELRSLILNDLYYHLQGELEGRTISPGTFKELSQYVIESNCLQIYQVKYNDEFSGNVKDVYLYDLPHIQSDMGLDAWDYTEWKVSKDIAEKMLAYMQEVNSMVLLTRSKLSALTALITVLTVYEENSPDNREATVRKIPNQLCFSSILHICQCFHARVESLSHFPDASKEVLDFLAAQAELLLCLITSAQSSLSLSVHLPVLKASGSGLKVLSDFQSSAPRVRKAVKLLLILVLLALELGKTSDRESEDFAQVSNACLALLPILCKCISTTEHSALSLTVIDLVLRSFLTPSTWFPIIQQHLQLQHVILKLQDKKSLATIPMTLKFLLTLARVRGGAEMLFSAGFLSSLGVLFADSVDGEHSAVIINSRGFPKSPDATEKPLNIWGIGLAVVTSMVHSLENSSSCMDIMDYIIANFFSEKAYLVSYYLNAPDFPSDDQEKKRPRATRTQTSLTALEETEHTLKLICTLAKHWNSWVKATKEMDSKLREKSIHFLAFISRGTHRHGESPSRIAPLVCPPILKEEFELCKKPSFLNSRNGWFALSPLCCMPKPKFSGVPSSVASLIIKGQSSEKSNPVSPTHFSDLVGQQIYKITFLLLKFLCLEAHGAAKRFEEVGFVDLTHIPELPMPEILHGLQDQAIAIVSELCYSNRSMNNQPEIVCVCRLLLHILEMALYLELFVLQICRIRPVLGRVEDFSKEVKLLMKATEGHAFLKASLKSLERVISCVYPGLLQTEGFL
uniref:Uncharacterized protein LOC105141252 isoform X2 n=1 Tax=Rhizophora mucronata TaxID=61149 RepID=A0A2P2LVR1_RHIMU